MFLCVSLYVCMCVWEPREAKKKNGVGLPGARAEGGCKPLGMGARNQTQVLGKRS